MLSPRCLAFDIGAESGRAVLGQMVDGELSVDEVHRFPNRPLRLNDKLQWDVNSLIDSLKQGLAKAGPVDSVGVDTWGVDFVLLDEAGRLLERPFCYRDRRTEGVMEAAFGTVSKDRIYEWTGIQFLPFNSLYQLLALREGRPEVLQKAACLLTIPDYLSQVLIQGQSGSLDLSKCLCEFTNVTTTQCYDPRAQDWAWELLDAFHIPRRIFPKVAQPGTILGYVNPRGPKVVLPASHDTGSAVASIEENDNDFAWISSGTWSVMGIVTPEPIITAETLSANLTNEGGVGGTFRLCKNVMGLWLVQQCRSAWGEKHSYDDLAALAEQAEPYFARLDVDDPAFLVPGNMPARIAAKLQGEGQPVPATEGQMIRLILEGLAFKYKAILRSLELVSERRLNRIHIVGGGSQNALLNRITEEICERPVVAGPAEATAVGNLMVQLKSLRG